MKIRIIMVALLAFPSVLLDAQTYFKPGYVIKSEGDTLFGEVDYRGDTRMSKTCTFRYNAKDSIHHFSPEDIKSYRFPESKYYISKAVNGKKVFLEFLINGRVNLYYLRDDFGDHYYMEKEGDDFTEIPYEEAYKKKNGQEYLYKSTKHIGLLAYYLRDAKGLQPEINKLKKPGHDNLIKLAEDYHNAVCDGDKCIIYEKKLPPVKIDFEIMGGFLFVDNRLFEKSNLPQAGFLAHIWMPRTNENLYFKTGLLVTPLEKEGHIDVGFQIPLQVEYIYPHGIIRPKFAIGTNLPFLTLDLSPGLNVRLSEHLFWSLNFNISYFPDFSNDINESFKISVFSSAVSTGLYIKF